MLNIVIDVSYSDFITLITTRGLTFYHSQEFTGDRGKRYRLQVVNPDGNIPYACVLNEGVDDASISDFETNYKAKSGVPILTIPKCTRMLGTTVSGEAILLVKVPGTPGVDRRWLDSGTGWFDHPAAGDFCRVDFVDHDNILGGGVDTLLETLYDPEIDDGDKGWWMPPGSPLTIRGFDRLMDIPSGMYIRILGTKGNAGDVGFVEDTMRVNIYWGKIS